VTVVGEQELGYAAARRARTTLGLGLEAPLADIVEVVEDLASVPVTVLGLPPGIAGLQGGKQGRHFVFLNGAQAVSRQRFTLAHELGHIEMGHGGSVDYEDNVLGSSRRAPREVQADGFAAEFMAPLDGVGTWLNLMHGPDLSLGTVVRLAHHFHVSARAALYRLQAVWRLSKSKYQPLEAAIDRGEHHELAKRLGLEPHADTLARACEHLPRLPRTTLTHGVNAYERGLLSVEQIAALLQVDEARIRAEFEARGATPAAAESDY
jgi:Zn-dependent peptidase ImmA (M78 family)